MRLFEGCQEWQQAILTDPQTSGGLLVSCASEAVETVLGVFRRHGFAHSAVIGRLEADPAEVVVGA